MTLEREIDKAFQDVFDATLGDPIMVVTGIEKQLAYLMQRAIAQEASFGVKLW
jgi:hypothetical protein